MEDGIVHKIRKNISSDHSILNLGLGGYGVAHVKATLDEIIPQIKPTRVLYLYFQNDTRCDNMDVYSKTVFNNELINAMDGCGRQLSEEEIKKNYQDFTKKRSEKLSSILTTDEIQTALRLEHLRGLFAQRYLNPKQIIKKLFNIYDKGTFTTSDPVYYAPKYQELAASMIIEMAKDTAKAGAKFTMVILPHESEAFYGLKEPATERLLANLNKKFPPLDILDLRSRIRKGTSLVYPGEGHYSKEGTTIISNLILHHIKAH